MKPNRNSGGNAQDTAASVWRAVSWCLGIIFGLIVITIFVLVIVLVARGNGGGNGSCPPPWYDVSAVKKNAVTGLALINSTNCTPGSSPTSSDGVVPSACLDNPSCASLGYRFGFKLDAGDLNNGRHYFVNADGELETGTPADPNNYVDATFTNGIKYFSFATSIPVDAVIVKAGQQSNVYRYVPSDQSDSGLAGVAVANDISHISFCYHYELNVNKTATGTYKVTHSWTIDKSVSDPSHSLLTGTSDDSQYSIVLNKTSTISQPVVYGFITVHNPSPFAVVVQVTDTLSGGRVLLVTCPSSTVMASSTLVCSYTSSPMHNTVLELIEATLNEATVTPDPSSGMPVETAQAGVSWSAVVIGFEHVSVSDIATAPLASNQAWAVSSDNSVGYTKDFSCPTLSSYYDQNGQYQYTVDNTATIIETQQSDSSSVTTICYAPYIHKQSHAYYKRSYDWEILKQATQTEFSGFAGDQFNTVFHVVATRTTTDSDHKVISHITALNPHPSLNMNTVSISDTIGVPAAIISNSCSGITTIGAAGSVICSVTHALAAAINGTNTAQISFNGYSTNAQSSFYFDTPTSVFGHEEVTIVDALVNATENNYSGEEGGLVYEYGLGCPTKASGHYTNGVYNYTVVNTAVISETSQNSSVTLHVSCTLPARARVLKSFDYGKELIGSGVFRFTLACGPTPGTVQVKEVIEVNELDIVQNNGVVQFDHEIVSNGVCVISESLENASGWFVEGESCVHDVNFPASADANLSCSFKNIEAGRILIQKKVNGVVNGNYTWTFAIYDGPYGSNVIASDTTDSNGVADFGGVHLDPRKNYTICELDMPAGWTPHFTRTVSWTDLNEDGYMNENEIGVLTENDTIESVIIIQTYNPTSVLNPSEHLGHYCFDINNATVGTDITPGTTLVLSVDDVRQSTGGQRTPGYWKNWNHCSRGNQANTAAKNGGAAAGYWLLEDALATGIVWDDINADNLLFNITAGGCPLAVSILDTRQYTTGKKLASDAGYNLARNLMAAQANFAAGAGVCPVATSAAQQAEQLLDDINFDASASVYLKSPSVQRTLALQLAGTLDQYNNGLLC